ncbi:hypothetical protein BOA8489_00144 [Boseongicola aestuarii]|uniref:Glycosyltransferase RgtA/B/C/D-like domain-containing protein n=2 Tax=Boseongicola aestuarii TaxID=1470561 RepID=A0A238IUR6_9RHOB|nr:hypothetical protein BOA8489_00144 [Boseongicola aestuarii]
MTSRISFIFSAAIVGFFLLFRVASPISIDTAYMIDTTFLANLGWRGVNGLSPVLDYWHFYGGFTEANLTLAFQLFGVSMKSVDFAFALIFSEAAALLALLSVKRLSCTSFWLLLAISATIILGPISIEDGYLPYTNHSFVYNHFAMIVIIAVSIFAINSRSEYASLDILSSLIVGMTLLILALTKPTFLVVAPFAVAACAIRKDLRAAALIVLGFVLALVFLDPWAVRFRGSLNEIMLMGQIERAGGLHGRMQHTLLTLIAHAGYLVVLGYFLWLFAKGKTMRTASFFASIFLCAAAFGAATLSMNGRPDLMMLPMIILLLTILSDRLKNQTHRSLGYFSATVMGAVLILPAAYHSGKTWLRMNEAKLSQLITEGPLANYVVLEPATPSELPSHVVFEVRLETAVSEAAKRLKSGGQIRARDPYVVLADGVHLLNQISDVSNYGIITRGSTFDFTVPMTSRPVPSFPVWPLQRSTSLLDVSEVDIIMSVRYYTAPDHLSPEATAIIAQEFRTCRESTFFILSVRRSNMDVPCN